MTTSTRSSYDQNGALDSAGSSDDIYDFSDVSYDDLSILKTELFHMMKRSETVPNGDHNNYLSQILAKHGTIPEEDDEEWYPPTPPPYDVLDKLIEANEFLDSDPTSSTHVAEKLRWRPDSRLVEIRWLGPKENSVSSISSNSEEIVILDTMNDLKLYDPSGSDSSMSSDLEQTKSLRTNISSCKSNSKHNHNNNIPELSGSRSPNGESPEPDDSMFNTFTGATARNRNSSSSSSSSTGPKRVPAKISPNLSVSKSNNQPNSFTSYTTTAHATTGASPYAQSQPTPISKCPIPRQQNQLKPAHRGTGSRCSSSASSTRSSSLDRRSQSANANTTTTTTTIINSNIKNNNNYANNSNKSHNHNRKASGNDKMSGSFSLPDLKGVANGSMIRANGSSSTQDQPSHISRVICRSRSPLPNPKRPILDKRKSDNFLRPPPTLQRKNSRNSLSSSSSTSSHSTGDDTNSDSSRREAADLAFEMWKQRKRQEKRLRERKVYLQSQQHRHLY
ncbi:nuclear transcription factor Y subunit alpha-like [Tigriopus californicus]|uniref:nuclear transcription factor Y subunit alpha-like n=1 Tax=Tigriopus californicus TaxID=6832 RepID=UPI0027DA01D2|nr:nuclear transcription factor Y subunit alpha-like [Tigriopus californicus]XP_059083808.1 nuclear transcription factor Y subunit alpha-like [Tigriopus californicus]XP_059083815.1 nuclear transcription factor Y subunit alpha-like [Tigriopus californicus]